MSDTYIFQRVEKKYRLDGYKYNEIFNIIKDKFIPDRYGVSTVCSLYLDTQNYLLIRNSIDAKAYKEKLRLRSYGLPKDDSRVFLEIKKKLKGVVYKRRISMSYAEALEYLENGVKPAVSQIMNEIDYAMDLYSHPKGKVCILCEREAYFSKTDPDLRITFDRNIRYRASSTLDGGYDGIPLIGPDEYIMEIKTAGAMPTWLANALSETGIFSAPFSKYATAYRDILSKKREVL